MNRTVFLVAGFLFGIYVSFNHPDVGDRSFTMVQDGIEWVKVKIENASTQVNQG